MKRAKPHRKFHAVEGHYLTCNCGHKNGEKCPSLCCKPAGYGNEKSDCCSNGKCSCQRDWLGTLQGQAFKILTNNSSRPRFSGIKLLSIKQQRQWHSWADYWRKHCTCWSATKCLQQNCHWNARVSGTCLTPKNFRLFLLSQANERLARFSLAQA